MQCSNLTNYEHQMITILVGFLERYCTEILYSKKLNLYDTKIWERPCPILLWFETKQLGREKRGRGRDVPVSALTTTSQHWQLSYSPFSKYRWSGLSRESVGGNYCKSPSHKYWRFSFQNNLSWGYKTILRYKYEINFFPLQFKWSVQVL